MKSNEMRSVSLDNEFEKDCAHLSITEDMG